MLRIHTSLLLALMLGCEANSSTPWGPVVPAPASPTVTAPQHLPPTASRPPRPGDLIDSLLPSGYAVGAKIGTLHLHLHGGADGKADDALGTVTGALTAGDISAWVDGITLVLWDGTTGEMLTSAELVATEQGGYALAQPLFLQSFDPLVLVVGLRLFGTDSAGHDGLVAVGTGVAVANPGETVDLGAIEYEITLFGVLVTGSVDIDPIY